MASKHVTPKQEKIEKLLEEVNLKLIHNEEKNSTHRSTYTIEVSLIDNAPGKKVMFINEALQEETFSSISFLSYENALSTLWKKLTSSRGIWIGSFPHYHSIIKWSEAYKKFKSRTILNKMEEELISKMKEETYSS